MDGWFSCGRHLLARSGNSFGATLTVHYGYSLAIECTSLYTSYCGALWDWMSALDNIHYGLGHHYKWLSQIMGGDFEPRCVQLEVALCRPQSTARTVSKAYRAISSLIALAVLWCHAPISLCSTASFKSNTPYYFENSWTTVMQEM